VAENIFVFDCDGHIIESIPEMVPFLDPVDREIALNPSRNRQGVFASLDNIHYPRNIRKTGEVEAPRLSPRALDPVVLLVRPARRRFVRHVRNSPLDFGELRLGALGFFLEGADLLLQLLHLRESRGIRSAADGGELVATAAFLLEPRHDVAATGVHLQESLDARVREALRHVGEKPLRVLAKELAW